jgi:hypothetical protein
MHKRITKLNLHHRNTSLKTVGKVYDNPSFMHTLTCLLQERSITLTKTLQHQIKRSEIPFGGSITQPKGVKLRRGPNGEGGLLFALPE